MMQNTFNRRQFLRGAGLAAAGLWAAPGLVRPARAAVADGKLRLASFGTGGMAATDIRMLTNHPAVTLVAVADVDLNRANHLKAQYPGVRVYQDWRQLLDQEKTIEAVSVTVPDHMHAAIGMSAMQLGKHLYGQKPLAHNLYETRRMTEHARQAKLVTQMGIQMHSSAPYIEIVQLIQAGAIGRVKEVHAWSCKKWGDASPRPEAADPVPANFDWDGWLGVAATRAYLGKNYYHPQNWRKRLDFGTGTFGDMGCHIYDPVFRALELTAPLSVCSTGPVPNAWNWNIDSTVHYVFPATPHTDGPTLKITWYDGDARPPAEVQAMIEGTALPDEGSIFIGTQGVILLPHTDLAQLYPRQKFADYPRPKVHGVDHWGQFVDACLGRGQTTAGFDYAGPLTEAVLLGSVACRFPQVTLQWNAAALQFDNHAAANPFLRQSYRPGWSIPGLS